MSSNIIRYKNRDWMKGYPVLLPTNQDAPYGVGNRFMCIPAYETDGMYKINTGIVTRVTSHGHEWSDTNDKGTNGIIQGLGKPQHIYILSDEEIKEGDWGYCELDKSIHCFRVKPINPSSWKKIIATTDKSLKTIIHHSDKRNIETNLPQPTQAFIEKYIKEYNKGERIEEVLVECADYFDGCCRITRELKVSSENTISIKELKDTWNREEVISICEKAFHHYIGHYDSDEKIENDFKKFIERNL